MKPMNQTERDRVAANVSRIKADLPEFVPFFKDLYELGMVTGWRDIDYVGPPRELPPGTKAVSTGQMVLESATALKERMKRGNH
jgi:hypothetical protein